MLLIDERPEEVTDMARSVNAEVMPLRLTNRRKACEDCTGIVSKRAKRMVECGHDVVIFSIHHRLDVPYTRFAGMGKVLSRRCGCQCATTKPKRFFGAARNI